MNNNQIYSCFGSFVLRTPLFPLDKLRDLLQGENLSQDALLEVCQDKSVQEALFLASPSFFREVQKWMDGKLPNSKEADKVMQGVMRYFARMCTRCTPFGMFAGISTGKVGEAFRVAAPYRGDSTLHVRLDMNYVCALAKDLAAVSSVKDKLSYFPNDSLYAIGSRLRYVEYAFIKAKRSHHIAAIDDSPYIQKVLQAAKEGKQANALALLLVDDEITFEEAWAFVNEMIDAQVLVSELEPTVIGADPLQQMINVLRRYNENEEIKAICEKLVAVDEALKAIRDRKGCHPVEEYGNIKDLLAVFPTQYDEKFLFQADMLQQPECSQISTELANEVFSAVAMLNKVTMPFENENLKGFRGAFYARYEDEEIPLAQALDTETGVGYIQNTYSGITPLVDDLAFPVRFQNYQNVRLLPFNVLLQRKLSEALRLGKRSISIEDNDLDNVEAKWDDTQETMSAFIQLLDGDRFYLRSAGGSCAANLIGRFCHLDASLLEHTRQIVEKDEADENVLYAEIVHLPESRVGNILHRPTIRRHEIPYLAHASVSADNQIPLDDLMVSVRGDRIILRSKSQNKEVVPRLTTAHNYSYNALPVYHFLCDMQNQGKRGGFGFSWGALENTQPYLPRVTYKNAILSLETWNFFQKDIDELNKIKDLEGRIDAFQKMTATRNMTDEVVLEDSDNELFLNLKNRFCVEVLLDLVKKRPNFTLKEFVFGHDGSPVVSKEGAFANEMLLAYYRNSNEGGQP